MTRVEQILDSWPSLSAKRNPRGAQAERFRIALVKLDPATGAT